MTATQAPTPGPLDWTTWSGGPRPHPPATRVRVRYRDGTEDEGASAFCDWLHSPRRTDPKDVVAYKVVREAPTAPVEASGSEDEDPIDAQEIDGRHDVDPDEDVEDIEWPESPLGNDLYRHVQSQFCLHDDEAAEEAGEILSILAKHGVDPIKLPNALRPQPSGETREGALLLRKLKTRLLQRKATLGDMDVLSEVISLLEDLSARPAPVASGGQQGEDCSTCHKTANPAHYCDQHSGGPWCDDCWKVGDCKDLHGEGCHTTVWAAMDPEFSDGLDRAFLDDTTPARAEAQDEGAAGEPVAWRYRWKPTPRSEPGDWRPPTYDRWSKDERKCFEEQSLYAHPSPTLAADADGVRELAWAVEQMREILSRLHFATDKTGFDESRDQGVRIADKALTFLTVEKK